MVPAAVDGQPMIGVFSQGDLEFLSHALFTLKRAIEDSIELPEADE